MVVLLYHYCVTAVDSSRTAGWSKVVYELQVKWLYSG